ncbi:MAG: glutamate ABC transporter substrate-binding protein [Pseudonocardiaceae bacterium]
MSIRCALASSAVAVVLLTGIAADQPSDHAVSVSPVSVSPAPAPRTTASPSVVSSAGSQPTAPRCDLLASLRPLDPLPEPGRMPAGSTMARIVERGRLIVAVGADTYLLSFRNAETGQLEGFDIDLAADLAEAIFGDRQRVEYRQLDLHGRLEAAASGDVDVVISNATITCWRRAKVEFSTVYYLAGQRVLVNRGSGVTGLNDLTGKRVCAPRGSTSLQELVAASGPVPVGGVPGVTDCLVMLQLGEVDAVSSDDVLLASLAAQDPRTEIVGPRFRADPFGIVINSAAPDLVRFVNAVLERRVADGRWRASYQRWLTTLGPPPAPPQPQYRD